MSPESPYRSDHARSRALTSGNVYWTLLAAPHASERMWAIHRRRAQRGDCRSCCPGRVAGFQSSEVRLGCSVLTPGSPAAVPRIGGSPWRPTFRRCLRLRSNPLVRPPEHVADRRDAALESARADVAIPHDQLRRSRRRSGAEWVHAIKTDGPPSCSLDDRILG